MENDNVQTTLLSQKYLDRRETFSIADRFMGSHLIDSFGRSDYASVVALVEIALYHKVPFSAVFAQAHFTQVVAKDRPCYYQLTMGAKFKEALAFKSGELTDVVIKQVGDIKILLNYVTYLQEKAEGKKVDKPSTDFKIVASATRKSTGQHAEVEFSLNEAIVRELITIKKKAWLYNPYEMMKHKVFMRLLDELLPDIVLGVYDETDDFGGEVTADTINAIENLPFPAKPSLPNIPKNAIFTDENGDLKEKIFAIYDKINDFHWGSDKLKEEINTRIPETIAECTNGQQLTDTLSWLTELYEAWDTVYISLDACINAGVYEQTHVNNSIDKHLHASEVYLCFDIDMLYAYSEYLSGKIAKGVSLTTATKKAGNPAIVEKTSNSPAEKGTIEEPPVIDTPIMKEPEPEKIEDTSPWTGEVHEAIEFIKANNTVPEPVKSEFSKFVVSHENYYLFFANVCKFYTGIYKPSDENQSLVYAANAIFNRINPIFWGGMKVSLSNFLSLTAEAKSVIYSAVVNIAAITQ